MNPFDKHLEEFLDLEDAFEDAASAPGLLPHQKIAEMQDYLTWMGLFISAAMAKEPGIGRMLADRALYFFEHEHLGPRYVREAFGNAANEKNPSLNACRALKDIENFKKSVQQEINLQNALTCHS